jgi:hypothetical protein
VGRGGGTTIALSLTVAALTVVPAGSARAVDPACPFTSGDVRTFVGTNSNSWADANNWSPTGIPNDNTTGTATPETNTTYVCIGTGKSVYMDKTELFNFSSGWVELQGYWLGKDATLTVGDGVALMNNDHTEASVTEHGSLLSATSAYVGGQGTLLVKGDLSVAASAVTGASSLTSSHDSQPIATQTQEGHVVIDQVGRLLLPSLGVQMHRGYDIDVFGQLVMTGSGFLAPHFDTSVTVEAGGTYQFAGWGGFYEGPTDSGPDVIPSLVNRGTLLKTGPDTALIGPNVDGYVEQGDAHIVVQGGTLGFAGGTTYTADVSGGQAFSTAQCTLHDANQPCAVELDPGRDPQSVAFTVPASDPGAVVEVTELGPLDFLAHATDLAMNPADPATLNFRLGAGAEGIGTTQPADVQITHDGVPIVSCVASGLPAGATNCVDRQASSYDGRNVLMVVRTIQTSRYVCHKEDVTTPSIVGTPAAGWKKLKRPITLTTTVDEAATVTVTGTVRAKGIRLPLQTVSRALAANTPGAFSLTFKKKLKKHQKSELKRARKVRAQLTITVRDAAQHVVSVVVPVTLR